MRSLALTLLLACAATGQTPTFHLVKDLNTSPKPDAGSSPRGASHLLHISNEHFKFISLGSQLIFGANDGIHGSELWACSTGAGSAKMIKDIKPGSQGSYPTSFCTDGKFVFFIAKAGTEYDTVWKTDGTAGGTTKVYTSKGEISLSMIHHGGYIYFTAKQGTDRHDLVKTDGTVNTVLMTFRKAWSYPVPLGNKIIFQGANSWGSEAWSTDGTASGTILLNDAYSGNNDGYCRYPCVMGGNCYYFARDQTLSYRMHRTDGTRAGTVRLGTISGIDPKSSWLRPMTLGSRIIFQGRSTTCGSEPWVTDGTKTGTRMLKDCRPGTYSGSFNTPVIHKGHCYFASNPGGGTEIALFRTDGTPAGTVEVSRAMNEIITMASRNNLLFLCAGKVRNKWNPWVSDGTTAGTFELKDIFPQNGGTSAGYFTAFNGSTLFSAQDTQHGHEMWITDGTSAGTRLLHNINKVGSENTYGSNPMHMVPLGGITLFQEGTRLFKTDGTPGGTTLVVPATTFKGLDLSLSFDSNKRQSIAVGGRLFFAADDGTTGTEIWMTDGTAAGTRRVQDTLPGSASGDFSNPAVLGHTVLFQAKNATGLALWSVDATGTCRLVSSATSNFYRPTALDHRLVIFGGRAPGSGSEAWVTDGTPAGTKLLKDTHPGNSSGGFNQPVAWRGHVYYLAYDGQNWAICRTDGTPAGTVAIGAQGTTLFSSPIVFKDRIYFLGTGGLWISDGTGPGTTLLTAATTGWSHPTVCGDRLYFAGQGANGGELWMSDGTAFGTGELKDILTGTASSYPKDLTPLGSRYMLFSAHTDATGRETWITDGTAAGTRMVADRIPGKDDGHLSYPRLSRGRIFGVAPNEQYGTEPHRIRLGATVQDLGLGHPGVELRATDPILGGTMKVYGPAMSPGSALATLLAGPTQAPFALPGGVGFAFNPLAIYTVTVFAVPGSGGSVILHYPIPADPALAGASLVVQGFVGLTPTPPFGLDLTNGLMVTLGR